MARGALTTLVLSSDDSGVFWKSWKCEIQESRESSFGGIRWTGGVAEDVYVKVGSFHFSADFVVVEFDADPRVPLILGRSFLKTRRALIDVFEGELTLHVGKEAITFNLDQTLRNSANYSDMTSKRIDVYDMACEEYSQEVLGFSDVIASGNPTPYYDLIVSTTSLTLSPFENTNFLLEEVDAFLAIKDDPTSPEVDQSYLDPKGDMLLLEAFLNDDPSLPPPNVEEKTALITVLKSHKRAITWKLSDIKGIDLEFRTHKILMEKDFEPTVQHQRRVNLKIHDVIKQEVIKLLEAGLIYPIYDSPWVSPVHCVPKKGGFIVVENEDNELILTRLVMGWRVCINYHKLIEATRKDHFLLPFMDQMLERLARNQYYCFLDGFSGYFQIPIDLKDQEKTTFTCPYETLAFCRMPFGVCNAPSTFQRCMMAIFHDMIEKTMKVFMDDFLVFGNSFQKGIVLGHKISKQGIEVDKAKVDVITKLPYPTTVKGIRSFLGHTGFYHRFIKDFSKIARPMTRLLEKDTPFIFFKECVEAFQTLKRKLNEAPILIVPDWDIPFELMCDASDFAIGAVLGQRQDKHFRPIHYANHSALKYLFAKKDSKLIMEAPPSPDYIPEPEVPPSPDYIPEPEASPSTDYIPGPEAPPSPDYILGPQYPEYLPPADDVLPAEEQPLPAAVSPTAESPGYIMKSKPEMEPEEEDEDDEKSEEDSIEYPTSRGDDDGDDLSEDDADDEDEEESSDSEEEEEEHLALTVPAPALYGSVSAFEETKPFEEGETAATPPSFVYLSPTSYPLPPFLMPLPIFTPLPTSSFPLPSSLPSTSGSESIPEVDIPLQKKARFTTPTGGYEVGESFVAAAARQFRPALTITDRRKADDRLIGRLRRERRYFRTLSTTYAPEVA
nr:reverse transcriptase domain-containing protein [Tanacetum cinerariifolium]